MAKMYFTFKWGKSIYITQDDLKKILLQYYTKEEVDNLLKKYTTTSDLLDILTRYAELDYVEREVERLDTKIDSVEDTLNSDIDELGNHVNQNASDLRKVEDRVNNDEILIENNSENITKNKTILDEVVTKLKEAKLWNIIGYYDNEITYNIGNVVGYTDDSLYVCLVDNTKGILPTNTSNWLRISGVQSFNLDDYYNKTQINELLLTKAEVNNTVTTDTPQEVTAQKTFKEDIILVNKGLGFDNGTNILKLDRSGVFLRWNGFEILNTVQTQTITGKKLYNRTPEDNKEFVNKEYVDNAVKNAGSGVKTFTSMWKELVPGTGVWTLNTSIPNDLTFDNILSLQTFLINDENKFVEFNNLATYEINEGTSFASLINIGDGKIIGLMPTSDLSITITKIKTVITYL